LSWIEAGIVEGTAVKQGQLLGAVGNSGSPLSLESPEADAHLHFELWLGEHHLGQFLRPIETRELIDQLFSGS
jgi:murein DD-endopeptidase MepM/ murein hydrolase activator NlpD